MVFDINGNGIALRTGDLIAYGDAIGYTVVWSHITRTYNVWHNLELIATFTSDDDDDADAMDTAREWIMANTFE